MLDEGIDFVLCSRAVFYHFTREVKRLAGQWVVRVNGHAIVVNLQDMCHKLVLTAVGQGNDGARIDVLSIKAAVDDECFACQFVYSLRGVLAKGLGGC